MSHVTTVDAGRQAVVKAALAAWRVEREADFDRMLDMIRTPAEVSVKERFGVEVVEWIEVAGHLWPVAALDEVVALAPERFTVGVFKADGCWFRWRLVWRRAWPSDPVVGPLVTSLVSIGAALELYGLGGAEWKQR